jgi:predicted TIM-barrel fold metal-dependent hydrolase
MPYGGHDWLALTQEPTLEPAMPICDPHHHFWDLRPERAALFHDTAVRAYRISDV